MVTYFDERPMIRTVTLSGWVITAGLEFGGDFAGFDRAGTKDFNIFLENGRVFNAPASYELKSDENFKKFQVSKILNHNDALWP